MGISHRPISCWGMTWLRTFTALCVLKRIRTACVQLEHNNEVTHGTCLFEVHLKPLQRASTLIPLPVRDRLCILYHLHDVGQRRWVTEGLKTPSGSFPEPPLSLPLLLLSKPSPLFSSRWEQVKWEIEFLGIWPVRLHPPFFFSHATCKRRRESRSVPSWESAFVFVLFHWKHTSVLSSTGGREEGGKAKLAGQLNYPLASVKLASLCARKPAWCLMLTGLNQFWLSFVAACIFQKQLWKGMCHICITKSEQLNSFNHSFGGKQPPQLCHVLSS